MAGIELAESVVRDLRAMYDAAHEAVRQRGCRIEDLTADEVIELAGIPTGRAAAAFGSDKVTNDLLWADLHADIKLINGSRETYSCIESGLIEFADQLESKDAVAIALVARELIRRSTNANSDAKRERDEWELHEASLAASRSPGAATMLRLASLRRVDSVSRLRFVELYASLGCVFGLRPKEPMTVDEFTNAVIATIEGLLMNHKPEQTNCDTFRPTGADGEIQRWTTTGVMFEALVLSSLEPDPWADFSADLSVWHSPSRC